MLVVIKIHDSCSAPPSDFDRCSLIHLSTSRSWYLMTLSLGLMYIGPVPSRLHRRIVLVVTSSICARSDSDMMRGPNFFTRKHPYKMARDMVY